MLLSQELKNKLEEVKAQAKNLTKADEIRAKLDEIKDLKAQIEMAEMEEEEERVRAQKQNPGIQNKNEKEFNALHVKAFAKAIAKKTLNDDEFKALSSNIDADGNYLIPKDVVTEINRLAREHKSLRELVTVIPVGTKEGSRILEIDAKSTGFTDIEELKDLPDLSSPQWTKVEYKIRDLGGLLPIPNHLLEDETGGLLTYLAQWFVDKMYATDNNMLLNDDGTKGSQGIIGTALEDNSLKNVFKKEKLTAILTFQKLKSIINKGFPRPISLAAKIVVNQDGLDILDNMEDKQGRSYLTGDGTVEMPYKFKGRVVEVYDNDTLANIVEGTGDTAKTYTPFIVGDLKRGMILWDRKQMSVDSSKEAGFKNNSMLMRGIIRQDSRVWDKKAVKVILSPII